jgi:hypothetical protein
MEKKGRKGFITGDYNIIIKNEVIIMISEKVVKAVEEQIRMFKGVVSEERGITVEEYRKYLKLTEGRGKELDPTEYIRKLRLKGEFY